MYNSIKKLSVLALLLCWYPAIVFSQITTSVSSTSLTASSSSPTTGRPNKSFIFIDATGDSMIVYTLPQARFWQSHYFKYQDVAKQLKAYVVAVDLLKKSHVEDSLALKEKDVAIAAKKEELVLEQAKNAPFQQTISNQKKEIRRQKFFKWVGWGAAALGGAFIIYDKVRPKP